MFEAYKKNPCIFDNVSPVNATYGYITLIKEYVNKEYVTYDDKQVSIQEFTINIGKHFDGKYVKDTRKLYFDKPLWRRNDDKYIIFHNTNCWVITASQYENEISVTCGGFASNKGEFPFSNEWIHF